MADILQFSRSTRVYIQQGAYIWEMPVLDGFSFSQATNATEIVLSEMTSSAGISRRGRTKFNDSYAPAEWSFSTYARPNLGSAVEEALWANFVAANSYNGTVWADGVTKATPNTTIDFDSSNSSVIGEFDIFFVLGGCGVDEDAVKFSPAGGQTIYKVNGAVANTASIDFEIDGIAMVNWSGFGSIITEEVELDLTTATGTPPILTGVAGTANFIRNRLTTLAADGSNTTSAYATFDAAYDLVLTGGNITFENNITFLTPETLCTVNQPIGHITGARSISGNFTCYLNATGTSSAELFEDLISATDVVTNSFDLTFGIGGATVPKIVINCPGAHLEIPQHSIEDVISVDVTFDALPSTLDATDEATIVYTGAA
jgi:hypothetical protein